MKKIALTLAAVASLGLVACSGADTTEANTADANVVETTNEAVVDVNAAVTDEAALNAADNALDAAGNAIENGAEAVENVAENVAQ